MADTQNPTPPPEGPLSDRLTEDERLEAELQQELQRISTDIKTILERVATADPALQTQAEATAATQTAPSGPQPPPSPDASDRPDDPATDNPTK